MQATVNVNGTIGDAAHAVVSVFDHGFLYGEGVYETLRTYGGEPFLFARHARRLRHSADLIALLLPCSVAELRERVDETLRAAALTSEAYIRILVTRGVGDLSYDVRATPDPTLVIIVKPHAEPPAALYDDGARVSLVSVVRNHPATVSPLIKSNNLMNSALAMQEAIRAGGVEAVMRNYRGEIAECSTANLFVVRDGAVLTPPVDAGLLPGITREFLFEVAGREGVPMREATLLDDELFAADEVFLSSTTREVLPIVRVDDRVVGDGRPGPLTRRLLAAFRRDAQARPT